MHMDICMYYYTLLFLLCFIMIVTPIVTTAAEMDKPVQETGEGTQESSPTVGTFCSVNGTLHVSELAVINTHEHFYTSNTNCDEAMPKI